MTPAYDSEMKIEFLPDGSVDCPVIRLYDFRPDQIRKLCDVCGDLADGRISEFSLHEQPWVESVDGCRFDWCANSTNVGVRMPRDGRSFRLLYTDEGWREIEGKISHLNGGFNWLTCEGEVNVLASQDGGW